MVRSESLKESCATPAKVGACQDVYVACSGYKESSEPFNLKSVWAEYLDHVEKSLLRVSKAGHDLIRSTAFMNAVDGKQFEYPGMSEA